MCYAYISTSQLASGSIQASFVLHVTDTQIISIACSFFDKLLKLVCFIMKTVSLAEPFEMYFSYSKVLQMLKKIEREPGC